MLGRITAAILIRKALRLFEARAYAEAEATVLRALEYQPDLAEKDQYLGILALKQDRVDDAARLLELAWARDEDITVAVARGAVELLRGRNAEARTWFGRALDAFPVLYELRYQIGLAWFRDRRRRKAVEAFNLLLKRDDDPLFLRLERLREVCGGTPSCPDPS